jgi:hypothetical protein
MLCEAYVLANAALKVFASYFLHQHICHFVSHLLKGGARSCYQHRWLAGLSIKSCRYCGLPHLR